MELWPVAEAQQEEVTQEEQVLPEVGVVTRIRMVALQAYAPL